jgi:hypothetical protein
MQPETAADIHSAIKRNASDLADTSLHADRDQSVWKHLYSQFYHSLLNSYHTFFTSPTDNDVRRYRKHVGDTVMDVQPLPRSFYTVKEGGSLNIK